jgi:hypothetical protein
MMNSSRTEKTRNMIKNLAFLLSVSLISIKPIMALTFDEIKYLPFMGGSLMFNQGNSNESHLAAGKHYAFRLGDLYTNRVPVNDLVGLTSAEKQDLINSGLTVVDMFEEIEENTKYGEILISSITSGAINFQYTLYNANGSNLFTKTGSLALGQSLDMNSDGKPDVEFTSTISSTRSNVSGISYLRFLSSQPNLYTSMFSYAPEVQPELKEFNLIGFNPSGSAIIRDRNTAYQVSTPGTVSTLAKASASTIVASNYKSGDYILDLVTGTYAPILNQGGALAKVTASAKQVEEVLPLLVLEQRTPFDLTTQRMSSANLDNEYLAEDPGQYTVNRDNYFSALTKEGRARFGPFSLGDWRYQIGNSGVKVGIKSPQISIGIGVGIKILWSKAGVKANVSAGFLFEGDIAASVFDGTTAPLFSAFTKVTDTLNKANTSFYKIAIQNQQISIPQTVINETILFSLGAIPVSWGMNQNIKFDINLTFNKKAQAGAKFYMYNMIALNARATVLDGSSIGFGPTNSKMEFLPYYQLETNARLSLKITPKYSLEPYVRIGPIVKATNVFYVGFENDWTVSYTNSELWFRTYLDFIYGLNVDVHIGKSFTLGAFGFSKEFNLDKSFSVPVISESRRIFDLSISKTGVTGAFLDKLVLNSDDKVYIQQKKLWAPLGVAGPEIMFLKIPAAYSLTNLLDPVYYSETAIFGTDDYNYFNASPNSWYVTGHNQNRMTYVEKLPKSLKLTFPIKGAFQIRGKSCFTPDLEEGCETFRKSIIVIDFPLVGTILGPLLLN